MDLALKADIQIEPNTLPGFEKWTIRYQLFYNKIARIDLDMIRDHDPGHQFQTLVIGKSSVQRTR